MSEEKNVLEQKDKNKWRDNPPKVTREEMAAALKCAAGADKFECDCWNTGCPYFGDCRKCVVFHMCLDQLPTCQRGIWNGDLEEMYIKKTRGE